MPSFPTRARRAPALPFSLGLALLLSAPARAVDQRDPSFSPPGGLALDEVPVFVVLGFDDNRYIDGMQWVLQLLEGKKNPAGKGNPSTYDGQPILASFYHTSSAAMPSPDGKDAEYKEELLKLWKRAVAGGHEVANHTHTHNTTSGHTKEQWVQEIKDCHANLVELLGIPAAEIVGFRTPYLDFGKTTFDALHQLGFTYEATVTHMTDFNKKQHVWPYTLHNGFSDRSNATFAANYPGLWELPVYTVAADITGHPPITGFDSSILTQANGGQFGEMLKLGIDYRLTALGNRAPMTVGLHSDTYSAENQSAKTHYDPQLGLAERKAALSAFIDYALAKPNVRFVTAKQLIQWLRKPVGLSSITPLPTPIRTVARPAPADLIRVRGGRLDLQIPPGGAWTVTVSSLKGEVVWRSRPVEAGAGGTGMALPLGTLPKGSLVVRLEGKDAAGAPAAYARRIVAP